MILAWKILLVEILGKAKANDLSLEDIITDLLGRAIANDLSMDDIIS